MKPLLSTVSLGLLFSIAWARAETAPPPGITVPVPPAAPAAPSLPAPRRSIPPPSPMDLTVDDKDPNPLVRAVRIDAPPVLDGALDDACWSLAPRITGFTHDTRPAQVETEVRVLYDVHTMYFGFVCRDPQPATIRAQQHKRNGGLDNDDTVSVGIDPRFDKQDAYWFTVNPIGTQSEDIPGGAAGKIQWRGDWRAAAKRTADGWTAELAVPFDVLKYPPNQRAFGLMFARNVPRLLEGSNWPVKTFVYVHDNEAKWADLTAPRIQRKPLVMPYVLGASGTIKSNSGLDVKYTSQNDVTSLLTLRPDFATIEDVVQTVDFSYNPRYLDDRRPFFTEGGDNYGYRYGFYSRSIGDVNNGGNPVDAGVKSFGKIGKTSFAGLGTMSHGKEGDGIASVGYSFNQFTNVSAAVFSRRLDPSANFADYTDADGQDRTLSSTQNNDVVAITGHHWKPMAVNGLSTGFEYYHSHTAGAVDMETDAAGLPIRSSADGSAFRVTADRYGADGVFEWHTGYSQLSPDYDARLAFIPERGLRNANLNGGESWQVKRGFLQRFGVYGYASRTNYWAGRLWHQGVGPNVGLNFRNDTFLGVGYDMQDRRDSLDYDPAADFYKDRVVNATYSWRNSDIYRRGNVFLRAGTQAGGPYSFADVSQGFKLTEKLSASADLSLLHLKGTRVHIDTARLLLSALYDISDERSVALRFLAGPARSATLNDDTHLFDETKQNALNIYAAYRQELRKGADIFVLAGDPNPNVVGLKSQIAVKYVVTY